MLPVSIWNACRSWSMMMLRLGLHLIKVFSYVTNVIIHEGMVDMGMILANERCDIDDAFPGERDKVPGPWILPMSVVLMDKSRNDSMVSWFFLHLSIVIQILCALGCIDIRPL